MNLRTPPQQQYMRNMKTAVSSWNDGTTRALRHGLVDKEGISA